MNRQNLPIGMIRHDELLNILRALAMTDCDSRTLEIVAQATGLSKYFNQPPITVELPKQQSVEVTK